MTANTSKLRYFHAKVCMLAQTHTHKCTYFLKHIHTDKHKNPHMYTNIQKLNKHRTSKNHYSKTYYSHMQLSVYFLVYFVVEDLIANINTHHNTRDNHHILPPVLREEETTYLPTTIFSHEVGLARKERAFLNIIFCHEIEREYQNTIIFYHVKVPKYHDAANLAVGVKTSAYPREVAHAHSYHQHQVHA